MTHPSTCEHVDKSGVFFGDESDLEICMACGGIWVNEQYAGDRWKAMVRKTKLQPDSKEGQRA